MKSIILLYLKAFLLFGIGFGLVTFLSDPVVDRSIAGLLIKTGFFGLFMSLALISSHIIAIQQKGFSISQNTIRVQQKKVVNSELPPSSLAQKLTMDPHWNKLKIRNVNDEISFNTRTSFWSWGEKILIQMKKSGSGQNQYVISSKPILGATLIDYGKNLQNVSRLEKLITA
ncbi:MAG: hypothetical protein M3R25_00235 [Bacteroidota bacterium]|nr:hypothetical protein [Bacteroidota bacterium]